MSSVDHLNVQLSKVCSAISAKNDPVQRVQRTEIAERLQKIIQQRLESCKGVTVEVYGSSASGLALTSSDVNLTLHIPGVMEKKGCFLIPQVMKDISQLLQGTLHEYPLDGNPRIEYVDSGLNCVIRVLLGRLGPISTTQILGLYASIDERACNLGVLFRYWAKLCKLDQQDKGHYPSVMFIIMTIHYLQHTSPPVLPVLHELKEFSGDKSTAENADAGTVDYLDDLDEIKEKWKGANTQCLAELWLGMLRYYSDFNMNEQIISIKQHQILKRELRGDRKLKGFEVQDPASPTGNIARASFSTNVFDYLKKCLSKTLDYFVSLSSSRDCSVCFTQAKFVHTNDFPTACTNCRDAHETKKCRTMHVLETFQKRKVPRLPQQNNLSRLSEVLEQFQREMAPTEQHTQMRKEICQKIQKDVCKVYPYAELILYGSSVNGFGNEASDLDICMSLKADREYDKLEVIENIVEELKRKQHDQHDPAIQYQNIVTVTDARVPIIKLHLPEHNLSCDISQGNLLALRNTKLLKAYSRVDKRVKVLVYAVKKFAQVCAMGDAAEGNLSSYAYILMVLHYLQRTHPPVVPVLQKLGRTKESGPIIEEWDCYFFEFDEHHQLERMLPGPQNRQCSAELWIGFLRYFTLTFDWSKEVVTIRQIESLSKFDKWWVHRPMCIEDPFNLEHNLASGTSIRRRRYILERFWSALWYHSKVPQRGRWSTIDEVMDPNNLTDGFRPPSIPLCSKCKTRGHTSDSCPNAT